MWLPLRRHAASLKIEPGPAFGRPGMRSRDPNPTSVSPQPRPASRRFAFAQRRAKRRRQSASRQHARDAEGLPRVVRQAQAAPIRSLGCCVGADGYPRPPGVMEPLAIRYRYHAARFKQEGAGVLGPLASSTASQSSALHRQPSSPGRWSSSAKPSVQCENEKDPLIERGDRGAAHGID